MWENAPRIREVIYIMLFACALQELHCSVIPALVAKKEKIGSRIANETSGVQHQQPTPQKKLECLWQAYTIMMTGDDKGITEECVKLLALKASSGMSKEASKTPESDAAEQKTTDLSSELHNLASQMKVLEPDYEDLGNGRSAEKRAKTSGEAMTKTKNNNIQPAKEGELPPAVEQDLDVPFVTSVKDMNEDFLVIPLNYLEKQAESDEDGAEKIKKKPETVLMEKDVVDDSTTASSLNEDIEKRNGEGAGNEDLLNQVRQDIMKIEKDLKALEKND